MELTNVKESSSSGKKARISPITDLGQGIKGAGQSQSEQGQSTSPQDSIPSESNNSSITLEDALAIFQESLLALRIVGGKFRVIPMLQPLGKTVIVFENIAFESGDFIEISSGTPLDK